MGLDTDQCCIFPGVEAANDSNRVTGLQAPKGSLKGCTALSRRLFGSLRVTGAECGEDHFSLLYTSFRLPTEITSTAFLLSSMT